jgi:hypothetical protein
MSVAAQPTPRYPNGVGNRKTVLISVERSELVGRLMDHIALAEEAVDANATAWQTTLRLPEGIWRDEMQAAHMHGHNRLKTLLAELRMAAGRYDGLSRDPDSTPTRPARLA